MAVKSRYVIGLGPALDAMVECWSASLPDQDIVRIEIGMGPDYRFDWSVFDSIKAGAEVFVALDERFGNFTRLEIFQVATERGMHMAAFVSPRALVAKGAKIGPNCFVGDGAIVGARAVVEYNCVVNPGVIVGAGVKLKSSSWLASGVQVGDGAEIGAHSTLRQGVLIAPRVKIGRNCEIGIPGHYREDIVARTVFDPRYDAPILVYGK
jgi:UDP-3-O-[3-hydroxymyristoyl] glucosamine N-acyltransferase